MLFEEQNLGNEYGLFVRRTDGAPPVRAGQGRGLTLSPDGKWVLATHEAEGATEMVLLPTGAGDDASSSAAPRSWPRAPRSCRAASGWSSPDTHRARASGLHPRPRAGRARPDQPQGITAYFSAMASPDGRLAFATGPDGKLTLYPVEGGEPRAVPGTSLDDIAIRSTADGRGLFFAAPRRALPARVERVDVATGERKPWLEIVPPDPAGVQGIGPIHMSADGRGSSPTTAASSISCTSWRACGS